MLTGTTILHTFYMGQYIEYYINEQARQSHIGKSKDCFENTNG